MKSNSNPSVSPDARERILQTAIRLFAEKGLHATTTRMISQEAGVNISLISYYFNGKEGLYQTILRQHAEFVETNVKSIFGSSLEQPMTRELFTRTFKLLMSTILENCREQANMKAILMAEINAGMPHSVELFDTVFDKVMNRLMSFVERAKQAGIVRPEVDAAFFVSLYVRSIDIYLQMSRCPAKITGGMLQIPQDNAKILQQMTTIFLEGALSK